MHRKGRYRGRLCLSRTVARPADGQDGGRLRLAIYRCVSAADQDDHHCRHDQRGGGTGDLGQTEPTIKIVICRDHDQPLTMLLAGRAGAFATDDVLLYGLVATHNLADRYHVVGDICPTILVD